MVKTTSILKTLISRRQLNIYKALKAKASRDYYLNSQLNNPIIKFSLPLQNSCVMNLTIHNLSGLLTMPVEYINWTCIYQKEFKNFLLINFTHVLYILAKHKITNFVSLFDHFNNFLLTINTLYLPMTNYKKIVSRHMSIRQHILVSLFKDKTLPIYFFNKFASYNIDFSQYSKGNILLLIETTVLLKNLGHSINTFNFTAINPDYPLLNLSLFSKNDCLKQVGQSYADWMSVRVICNHQKENVIKIIYKDSKMYQSGILQGRLTLIPNLFVNDIVVREYLTKFSTSIQVTISINNIRDKSHILFKTLHLIKEQEKILLDLLKNCEKDENKNFINITQKQEMITHLINFNSIIIKLMNNPELTKFINFGIGIDPGIDKDFVDFYNQELKFILEHMDHTQFDFNILLNNEFTIKDYNKQLNMLISIFPKEMQKEIFKALEFINQA